MDKEMIKEGVKLILKGMGEDIGREGLLGTPTRVADMYEELFSGIGKDPAEVLEPMFEENHDEIIIVKDIPFYSFCEHHLIPFIGKAHIAYVPNESGKIIGLSKLIPYMLVIGAFTAIYILIPHTNVKWKSALLGGLFAGILWETIGWGFASFIVGSAKYEAVYSGFATVILFLFWLYLNWLVLLLGASIAFYHQNPAYQVPGGFHKSLGNHAREALALEILCLVGKAYQDGSKHWTLDNLVEQLSLPMELINDVLEKLLSQEFLIHAGENSPYFVPGRDLQAISIKEVLDVVRGDLVPNHTNEPFADGRVIELLNELDSMTDKHLSNKTIKDLISPVEA